jgi:hypothetical protein
VPKRTLGVDLGINAPCVAVGLDEQGAEVLEATRFELSLEELERVEQAALRGAKPGTKLRLLSRICGQPRARAELQGYDTKQLPHRGRS